jgi:hypothetical protein
VQRILCKNRNEAYYQGIIARFLGNTHENLYVGNVLMGTTDVSTPELHAEIKSWKEWKHAMGQLIAYHACDPRTQSQAYLFGRYDEDHKRVACDILKRNDIIVYDCHDTEDGIEILDYATKEVVYVHVEMDHSGD